MQTRWEEKKGGINVLALPMLTQNLEGVQLQFGCVTRAGVREERGENADAEEKCVK